MFDVPLEESLVFLNEDQFALNALLEKLHMENRPGVYPFLDFPPGFTHNMYNRQNKMTDEFVADTNQHNQVKAFWALLKGDPTPPISGTPLDSLLQSIKSDVARIRARGGDVLFVRPPSSGFFLMAEQHLYPRQAYWDRLLSETGCKGIYYSDYPAQAKLYCPEFSHLTPKGAVSYTNSLVSILEKEKGWSFAAAR